MTHKNLVLFFALSLLPFWVFSQLPSYPLPYKVSDYAPYKGISRCVKYKLEEPNAKPQPNQTDQVWEYNKNGMPITEYSLAPLDEEREGIDTTATSWLTYNDNGWLTRKRIEMIDSDDGHTLLFTYNKKGVLTNTEGISKNTFIETYTYDKKGFLKEIKITEKLPKDMIEALEPLTYRHVYTTNEKGQITSEIGYPDMQSNVPSYSAKREFNEKGQITHWIEIRSDGIPYNDCVYTYDKKGRLASTKETKFESVIHFVYKYTPN